MKITYYDITYKYKDGEKTVYGQIGKAFVETDGSGIITARITALPIMDRWDYKLILFPHED